MSNHLFTSSYNIEYSYLMFENYSDLVFINLSELNTTFNLLNCDDIKKKSLFLYIFKFYNNIKLENFSFLIIIYYIITMYQTYSIKDKLFRILIMFELIILSLILLILIPVFFINVTNFLNVLILISLAACETAVGLALLISQLRYLLNTDLK